MITEVRVEAPCRIDIGNTWDIPLLMLSGRKYTPSTIVIALDMPTIIRIREGKGIVINDSGIERRLLPDQLNFHHMVECILGFFDVDNIHIEIAYNAPSHVGLGGSGLLCVSLIKALSEFLSINVNVPLLAHDMEHGHFSITGYQDQFAAFHGGVKYWEWQWPVDRSECRELLSVKDYNEVSDRLLIAAVGRHNSTDVNSKQLATYCDPLTREEWIKINQNTKYAAEAIEGKDWESLAFYIQQEHDIRNKLVPERIAGMEEYIKICKDCDAATGTPGAGQAAIFAFGKPESISDIKEQWAKLGATILSSKIAQKGVDL